MNNRREDTLVIGKAVPVGSPPNVLEDLMAVAPLSKVPALQENVEQLGRYIVQMGQLIGQMQKRMDEMEARQAAVTVRHADVKRIQARIRSRADEICGKYGLADKESAKKFRAAMKKDILRRWAVKDLHDLPDAEAPAVEKALDSWADIRLVMERRASL